MSRWSDLYTSLGGTHGTYVTEGEESPPCVASVPSVAPIEDREQQAAVMNRWTDAFASLSAGTHETHDDTCPPSPEPKSPCVASVPCVTPIGSEEKRGTTAAEEETAPDPAALDARATQLMAEAERSPVVKIVDRERALLFFRGRAALELTPERFDPAIHRRRSPDWSDPTDVPRPGDRCSCCSRGVWWGERDEPRGWRCQICHPPAIPFVRQVRT